MKEFLPSRGVCLAATDKEQGARIPYFAYWLSLAEESQGHKIMKHKGFVPPALEPSLQSDY